MPSHAPDAGCFGALTVFAQRARQCRTCPRLDACAAACGQQLNTLQGRGLVLSDYATAYYNALLSNGLHPMQGEITPAPLEARSGPYSGRATPVQALKRELSVEQAALISHLPKKVAEAAQALYRSGRAARLLTEAQAGRNPFPTGRPAYLAIAFNCLIEGGFSRAGLKQCYLNELQWATSTAESHVSMVVSLLTALTVIRPKGGQFILV